MNMKIAIIGTAGRNPAMPMTAETWEWMLRTARAAIIPGTTLVSGGAAWADHLAVALFLEGHVQSLELYLPAPMKNGEFVGPWKSAASAANYYHEKFSRVIGCDSRGEIMEAASREGCIGSVEPEQTGYSALFARNQKIVQALDPQRDGMLAFTFGIGHQPADGGTKHTWDLFASTRKAHFTIPTAFS